MCFVYFPSCPLANPPFVQLRYLKISQEATLDIDMHCVSRVFWGLPLWLMQFNTLDTQSMSSTMVQGPAKQISVISAEENALPGTSVVGAGRFSIAA